MSMVRIAGACTEINFQWNEELKRYKVVVVVRVCEAIYSPDKLLSGGIQVIDLSFPDGQPPPQQLSTRLQTKMLICSAKMMKKIN